MKALLPPLVTVSSARWVRAALLAVATLLALPAAHSSGNGTVLDTTTGLQWDQCVYGKSGADCLTVTTPALGSSWTSVVGNWSAALTAATEANAANYKGYNDWRMPNINELESIVKLDTYTGGQAAIDTTAFPNTPFSGDDGGGGATWTSTTNAPVPGNAWIVNFYDGGTVAYDKTRSVYVRLVRSGQSLASFDKLLSTQAALTLTSVSGTFGAALPLTATGGSGTGALSYVVSSAGTAGCFISGGNLYATAAGTCTVTATKASDGSYNSASSAATTVTFASPLTSYTDASPSGGSITAGFTGGGSGCSYTTSQFSAPQTSPTGVTLIHGVFSFTTNNCGTDSTLNFTITYPPGTLPANTKYYKYGPEFGGDQTPHWYELTSAVVNGNQITFSITDRGAGDSDPRDGFISDPGGPGVPSVNAASIPTLSEWGMILLASMLGMIGLGQVRRRR
jgi:hypothetical protein